MISNLTFWNNDIEFKERERKKRLEYGILLRQQIEEDQKRKEEEKKKRAIEDAKYLRKFENRSYQNINYHKFPLIENGNNSMINYRAQQIQDNKNQLYLSSNFNNNDNYNKTLDYNNYSQNKQNYYNQNYNNQMLISNNNLKMNNYNILNPNIIQRYNYENQYNNPYEINNIKEQSSINLEIKNKEKEINIKELFQKFVEEQIRIINNYDNSISNIINTQEDNFKLANFFEIEKKRTRQLLENGKNLLKKNLGYFPLEINYNRKIEELFNKILNKKVIEYNSINIENGNINKGLELKDEKKIMKELDYQLKNESIEKTFPNFENLDKVSQKSLIGFSKLVKVNEKEDINENFLITWRDNLKKEKESSMNNENINSKKHNNMNKNNNHDKTSNNYEKQMKKYFSESNNINIKNMDKKPKKKIESPKKKKSVSQQKIYSINIPNLQFPDIKKFDKLNDNKNLKPQLNSSNYINDLFPNKYKEENKNDSINLTNNNDNINNNMNKNKKKEKEKNEYNNESKKKKDDKVSDHINFSSSSHEEINEHQNNDEENNINNNNYNNYNNQNLNDKDKDNHYKKNNNISNSNMLTIKDIEQSFNSLNNNNDFLTPKNYNNRYYSINPKIKKKEEFLEDKHYSTNYYNSPPIPNKKRKKKKRKIENSFLNDNDTDNNFYTENYFRENRKSKLPPIVKERINQRPGTASINNHHKRNLKKKISSDNDSILKDLDRFRQLALNDIGYLDNNHYNYYDSRPKQVDLIPKEVIRNYDKVISSGNSSYSKKRKIIKYI